MEGDQKKKTWFILEKSFKKFELLPNGFTQ